MNKEVLVALIAKDVNELQTLTEGLDQMEIIPAPYLRLAFDKSKALTANLENLINYLNTKEIEDKLEVQRQAELAAKQAEEAAREAELARIAEEQEALFKAEELERQRREEERLKAEAEIARQVAAIEAARQLELEEKRRREEEEARRIAAEQEAARQREEEVRRQAAEEEARRVEDERRRKEEEAQRKEEESVASIDSTVPIDPISTVGAIDTQVTTLADSIETSESLADKLAKNADDTLASALNSKKIKLTVAKF